MHLFETFLLWLGLNIVLATIIRAVRLTEEHAPLSPLEILTLTIALNTWISFGVVVLLQQQGIRLWEIGLHRARLAQGALLAAVRVAAWMPAILLLNIWIQIAIPPKEANVHLIQKLLTSGSMGLKLLAIVAATVTAPIAEELLFRGLLQTWLCKRIGAAPGVVMSALLFAGMHFSTWPDPIALFPAGLLFGTVYQQTRSLSASILAHSLFNSISVCIALMHQGL
jgi:membrane protease YdiL (CAAX protease family)